MAENYPKVLENGGTDNFDNVHISQPGIPRTDMNTEVVEELLLGH